MLAGPAFAIAASAAAGHIAPASTLVLLPLLLQQQQLRRGAKEGSKLKVFYY